MIPWAIHPTLCLSSWLAAIGADSLDSSSVEHPLSTADFVLFVLAILILLLSGGLWLARSRGNPLANAPSRPNRVREDAVALAVIVFLMGALLAASILRGLTGQTEGMLTDLVVGNGAHLAGIGVCLFVGATRFEGGLSAFWFGRDSANPLRWAAYGLTLGVVTIAMCPLVRDATVWAILRFDPGFEFGTHPTVLALHDPSVAPALKTAFWIGAVVIAPVSEELFFRGLIQTFLGSLFRRRWPAIVIAAILFGAVHYQQPSTIPALAVLAIFMGFAYEKTGSLIPPVAIHAAFNLKTLIWDAAGGGVT